MKKSLQIAIDAARQHSLNFPKVKVRVMDMPKKPAVFTASEWVYKERVLSGYHTVITFVNGEEV